MSSTWRSLPKNIKCSWKFPAVTTSDYGNIQVKSRESGNYWYIYFKINFIKFLSTTLGRSQVKPDITIRDVIDRLLSSCLSFTYLKNEAIKLIIRSFSKLYKATEKNFFKLLNKKIKIHRNIKKTKPWKTFRMRILNSRTSTYSGSVHVDVISAFSRNRNY